MITLPPIRTFDVPLALRELDIRARLNAHREPALPLPMARRDRIALAESRERRRERLHQRNLDHGIWLREQRRLKAARQADLFTHWGMA